MIDLSVLMYETCVHIETLCATIASVPLRSLPFYNFKASIPWTHTKHVLLFAML